MSASSPSHGEAVPELSKAYEAMRQTGRGKHIGNFSYFHIELIHKKPCAEVIFIEILREKERSAFEYNVIKLDRRSQLSFLLYEDFSVPFPALRSALSIDFERGTCRLRDYRGRRNPPILHRKELLLPSDHPLVPQSIELTQKLERLGAYESRKMIGTRNAWGARLNALGIVVENGT